MVLSSSVKPAILRYVRLKVILNITKTRYRPLRDVTIANPPQCPALCHLYGTVYWRKQSRKTQNGRTVLLIANLTADLELESPDSYSSFLVTIRISSLVLEIFVLDRQTANMDHSYSWPPHCGGPANKFEETQLYMCHQLCWMSKFVTLLFQVYRRTAA